MAKSHKKVSFQDATDHEERCDEEDFDMEMPSNDCGEEMAEGSNEDDEKAEVRQKPKQHTRPLNKSQMQLIKQKHLQKQSMKVIESLLEPVVDEDHLRKSLPLLCKSEINDLVTERHLSKVCGYPLCNKALTERFNPRQKFKIDLKNRVLHNYEDRIKFCSILCMESTEFLTSQMPDEPLWMRYKDSVGYEGLYEKCAHIKFHHERGSTEATEAITAVTRAIARLQVRQVKKSDFVSLPYIKDEHMDELKKSLFTLEIKERSSVDDDDA